jgi:hypothetical protein
MLQQVLPHVGWNDTRYYYQPFLAVSRIRDFDVIVVHANPGPEPMLKSRYYDNCKKSSWHEKRTKTPTTFFNTVAMT